VSFRTGGNADGPYPSEKQVFRNIFQLFVKFDIF
jgi:hypothetical protein